MRRDFFTLSYDDKSVKVLEIKKDRYICYGEEKFVSGTVSSGKILRKENFAETVKVLLSKTKPRKITSKFAVVAVPESKVFIKIIEIPKIPLDKVEQAIDWQAESLLPIAKENLYLDWQQIAETPETAPATPKPARNAAQSEAGGRSDGGRGKIKILITACPKEVIDPLIESLALINLSVLAIKSKAGALAGLFASVLHKPILVINIEDEETSLIITKNQVARVSTSIPTTLGNSSVLDKIQETINFYEKKKLEKEIQEIVIIGEENLEDLKKEIANKIKLPVKIGHYPPKIKKIPIKDEISYIINLSLAFDPLSGVNLLPEILKNNISIEGDNWKFKKTQKLILAISVLLLLLLSIFWWILVFEFNKTDKVLESLQLAQVSPKVQEIEKQVNDLNQRIPRIESLSNQRTSYHQILEKINSISENGVKILEFSFSQTTNSYKISGIAETREQLLNYRQKLQLQDQIKNISIPLKSLERPANVNFDITFTAVR